MINLSFSYLAYCVLASSSISTLTNQQACVGVEGAGNEGATKDSVYVPEEGGAFEETIGFVLPNAELKLGLNQTIS